MLEEFEISAAESRPDDAQGGPFRECDALLAH
jgi:hypothetical protein